MTEIRLATVADRATLADCLASAFSEDPLFTWMAGAGPNKPLEPKLRIIFDAFAIPDRFQVTYEGQTLLDTGFVSGGGAQRLTYSGSSTQVTVTVIGNANIGTAWTYIVNCPT